MTTTEYVKRLGLGLIVAVLVSSAQGQLVPLTPTNYSSTVLVQNNLGRLWPSWVTEVEETTVLKERTLTITHIVYFRGVILWGHKLGSPKLLEDRREYAQLGPDTYQPARRQKIIWYAPLAKGDGWVVSTNNYTAAQLDQEPDKIWLPLAVGSMTTGDNLLRRVTTTSNLECWGRNLANARTVVRVRCIGNGQEFSVPFSFAPNERKVIALGLDAANENVGHPIFSPNIIRFFTFDLDDLRTD